MPKITPKYVSKKNAGRALSRIKEEVTQADTDMIDTEELIKFVHEQLREEIIHVVTGSRKRMDSLSLFPDAQETDEGREDRKAA